MAEPRIRVGLAGLGDIALVHAGVIRQHPQFELVGGVDLSARQRVAFAKRFGVLTFETLDELLGGGVDVVLVCVPNAAHAELTIKALDAGALVLCEKPPALNALQARQMATAAERNLPRLRARFPKATGNLLYGLVYRHMLAPYLSFASREALGQVPFVNASWERARGVPARGLFTNLAASGGGAGIDLGVHVLDLAWWALGCPRPIWVGALTSGELARTTKVMGYGPYDSAKFEVEDTMAGVVAFPGTMLVVHAAFASNVPGGVEEDPNVVWRGDRSGLKFRLHTADRDPRELFPEVTGEQFGFLQATRIRTPRPLTVQEGYERQIEHLVSVLRGGMPPIVTPQQGVALMEIMDGLYGSAAEQAPRILGRLSGGDAS
jgi:predicted dehydrogenase